jgi:hypothetical protein
MKTRSLLLTLATASLLTLVAPARAADYWVTNLYDGGPGSLRQAIADANALAGADVIRFTNSLAGQISLTNGQLLITGEVTIEGPGAKVLAVDAGQQSRVLQVGGNLTSIAVTIRGLTLRNGRCPVGEEGAGILLVSSTSSSASLTLEECAITGNTVPTATVAGARSGGGVFVDGFLVARRCLFADNVVESGAGGAVLVDYSATATLENCTLAGNKASQGGGVYQFSDGQLTMEACTVTTNTAFDGGGAAFQYIPLSLRNCVFAGNTAPQGPDILGPVASQGYNLIGSTANSFGWLATDLLNTNALLGPLADNGGPTMTCALLSGSPAIDAGTNSVAVDQRNVARPQGLKNDIGAFELAPCGIPVVAITAPAAGAVHPVNTPVTFTGTFDSASGPHTAQWNIDGNLRAASVNEPRLTVSNTFTFAGPGVYSVQLTVTNTCANSTTTGAIDDMPATVVIYDPSAGFVTGGGWINSPTHAYAANPLLTGKAHFAFVSKYQKGTSTPTGETSFQFNVAALNFSSQSYDWLVLNGARAQYKGVGTVNGTSGFGFMLTAIDGQLNGGGGTDKFRIKIWDLATSDIVYDNQMGASDSATPSTGVGGGSIQIKK